MAERRHRQMKGLFQRELTCQRRMHRLVGEAHPGRAGGEGEFDLRRVGLIGVGATITGFALGLAASTDNTKERGNIGWGKACSIATVCRKAVNAR